MEKGERLIVVPYGNIWESKKENLNRYLLCELCMRHSDAVFPFAAHPKSTVESVAEFLAKEINPHLYHRDYEWMLVKGDKQLPGWMSLEAVNIRSGDAVLLLGNHRMPEWAPCPPCR